MLTKDNKITHDSPMVANGLEQDRWRPSSLFFPPTASHCCRYLHRLDCVAGHVFLLLQLLLSQPWLSCGFDVALAVFDVASVRPRVSTMLSRLMASLGLAL